MEKSGILTQETRVIARMIRHRWTVGMAGSLSAFGVATAIAVAPLDEQDIKSKTIVEQLAVRAARPVAVGNTAYLREEQIQKGDTLGSILARLGVQEPEALEYLRVSRDTQVIQRQLAPGKVVVARTSEDGDLFSLTFPLNGKNSALVVERINGRLTAQETALRFEKQVIVKTAEIRNSLFAATEAAGIPDGVATQMAEIFGGDIDFHRDLRKNDRFSVAYEMLYLNGQAARSGRILAAEFVNDGKAYRAIHFENEGRSSYYTPEGKNLRKAFLRSPLEFSRVTSGFAMRFHPILQQWRAHKGVDYGAPRGTRVRTTSDGVVEFAGRQGGYGNIVIVKHSGDYSTAYGHLQGFSPGIRKGARVNQGDIVGYVGQTGWATGPHLHYEFRINNRQVNPLALNLPISMPLEASQQARFKTQAAPLTAYLDLLRHTTNLAALE